MNGAGKADANRASGNGQTIESPPVISLPKGGGAIRGIGEKFSVNPVTGTGSLTVPIFTSPGRSDFSPKLSLSYDSGSGNGPFALGWHLSVPSIARKTDKGLPRYDDLSESDVFILSGAEDLIPVLIHDGSGWQPVSGPDSTQTYTVKRYRPRIEGLFARIERWRRKTDGDIHWRAITKDNVTSIYGQNPRCRITDPADSSRVFKWLLEATFDDKGNVILYEYKTEDATGINVAAANERNRLNGLAPFSNLYLKRIHYGPQTPYQRNEDLSKRTDWLFEVVFDYGEHDPANPTPAEEPGRTWKTRADPFSNFRSTFDIRTYRLCQRILMFHHFPKVEGKEAGYDGLVRSTDFGYDQQDPQSQLIGNPVATKLTSITQIGYKWDAAGQSYLKKSFPPLEFTYAEAQIDPTVRTIEAQSLENLPAGVDGSNYRWLDLDGEGSSGILTEQAGAIFYKRNLSAANTVAENGNMVTKPRFAPVEVLASEPEPVHASMSPQFMDLAANGNQDMVSLEGPLHGYYERADGPGWGTFTPFESFPNIETRDPNLKFIDIDGDGLADILISEDGVMSWYPSLGHDGFGSKQYARKPTDEERGPALVFNDPTQSIFLADMSGGGLTDIVRIRNGEVCYWPNLGYGQFGPKVTVDGSPYFDRPELFDPRRIRLGDIDGSGTTDILYLGADNIVIYFNQSGNSLAKKQLLSGGFPATNNLTSINVLDLLGSGTACLVWSSPLASDSGLPMQYVDLMGGQKPHLLIGVKNNLGAETRIRYAPSTKFYIEDLEAGKPWVTKLAFPVHVAERVELFDYIGRTRLVSTYRYRHGYFDGVEREFRGFGYVEQRDAESFGDSGSLFTEDTDTEADALHVPPIVTKTWFHTGAWPDEETIIHHTAADYFGAPTETDPHFEQKLEAFVNALLPDTILPADIFQADGTRILYSLTDEEQSEAIRALKGTILRQEIYADDGTGKAKLPYSVSQRNYTIECLQPQGANRSGVFFTHARETIDHHYERNPSDPRVTHNAVLKTDPFGNVVQSLSAAYGRNPNAPGFQLAPVGPPDVSTDASNFAQSEQATALFTLAENAFTNLIDTPGAYRAPAPSETCAYELTRPTRPDESVVYSFTELEALANQAIKIPYETMPNPSVAQKRLIEKVRVLYLKNDLSGSLPPGQMDSLGLLYETYKLALTSNLAQKIFVVGNFNPNKPADVGALNNILSEDCGFVNSQGDSDWWIASGRTVYSPVPPNPPSPLVQDAVFASNNFYLPQAQLDPFGEYTRYAYDSYKLLLEQSQDALGNTVRAQNDYRVLQPKEVTDPNRNHVEVTFHILGMVVGTAIKGKVTTANLSESGDSFATFTTDLAQVDVDAFINSTDPRTLGLDLLGTATSRIVYDLDRFSETRSAYPSDPTQWKPVFAATIARETHVHNVPALQQSKAQVSFSYSDGLGREIQKKVQAEPGPLDLINLNSPRVNPRWVGSGWTILNNKGKPVRQYEPFFSATHDFEFAQKVGVSATLFYDPSARLVATLHPNRTWAKVVFGPWLQRSWDVNDTVLLDPTIDADMGELFKLLPDSDYLPTWYQLRTNSADAITAFPDTDVRDAELDAANKTAIHNDTPVATLFDVLGRPFLSVTHNRFQKNSLTTDAFYEIRTELDIEGNQLSVMDARGRVVMRFDYNMLKARIHQASMEGGERWMLNDVVGKPIYAWDDRGFMRVIHYDELRRLVALNITGNGLKNILAEKTVFGDSKQGGPPVPELTNHRTRVFQRYDAAGMVTTVGLDSSSGETEGYDFKGNLLRSKRQLLGGNSYKVTVDWSQPPPLDETFESSTTYDALNRPTSITSPDSSVYRPVFNEASLLERLDVNLQGAHAANSLVANIDYDAKGQRTLIEYANGTSTVYVHDPQTFRLIRLLTKRPQGLNAISSKLFQDASVVQDINYTYDPADNITRMRNVALPVLHYNNERIDPICDYIYDALYRLLVATGREHIGQAAFAPESHTGNLRDYPLLGLAANSNDLQALRNYTEQYDYDPVGNIQAMVHVAQGGNWTRNYNYNELNLLEPGEVSNRLSSTQVGSSPLEQYFYDAHGNVLKMPHLPTMEWDFKDQLHTTKQQVVHNGDGEQTYYVYDSSGQRVRKVTELNGIKKNERIYLGAFETYREYAPSDGHPILKRDTLHVMDNTQRVALIETRTLGSTDLSPPQLIRYQFSNYGSANLELDDKAQIISYEEYYPYGSTSYQATSNQIDTPKRYRYTGMERDEESGLNYHTARYYVPWLGRWTSCDPAQLKDGANIYAYSRCNPITRTDERGQDSRKPSDNPSRHAASKQNVHQAGGTSDSSSVYSIIQAAFSAQHRGSPMQAADIALRDLYKAANVARVANIQHAMGLLGDANDAAIIAQQASEARNLLRAATRSKLTPIGRVLSRLLDKDRSWATIVKNYGDPFDEAVSAETRLARANKIIEKSAATSSKMNALQAFGKGLLLLNTFVSGWQIGTGIRQVFNGETGEGVINIAEGGTGLGLTIGTTAGLKSGALTVVEGTGTATFAAGVAATASVALAFEEIRSTARGEKPLTDQAVDFWKRTQEEELQTVEREGHSVGGALGYVGAEYGKRFAGVIPTGRAAFEWVLEEVDPFYILGD